MKTKQILLKYTYWKTTTREGINAKAEDHFDITEFDVNSGVLSESHDYGYLWILKLKHEFKMGKYIQAAKKVLYRGKRRDLLATMHE